MTNNITNNQLVFYILHDDFNYQATLKNTLGALLYELQENRTTKRKLTSKEIRAEYNSKYKTPLPLDVIDKALEKYFEPHNSKYDFKPEFGQKIADMNYILVTEEKKYEESKNFVCGKYKEYYKIYNNREINKREAKNEFEKILNAEDSEVLDLQDEIVEDSYLVKKRNFLRYLYEKGDKKSIEFIENVTIANSIIDFGFSSELKQFEKCIFYLDTPVLLKYFGYDGKAYKEIYNTIFETLYKQGCKFRIFPHTVDETYGIVYAISSAYNHLNFSAPGVDMYLKARKEFGERKSEYIIPLNKTREEFEDFVLGEFKQFVSEQESLIDDVELTEKNNTYDYQEVEKLFEDRYQKTYKSFPARIKNDVDSIVKVNAKRVDANSDLDSNAPGSLQFFMLTDNRAFENISIDNFRKKIKKQKKENVDYGEILFIDRIIYSIWKDAGKITLPRELFKQRCVFENVISSEFRDEFNKLIARIELMDKIDVSEKIKNNPEIIAKAHDVYTRKRKSLADVEKFLKNQINGEKSINSYDDENNENLTVSIIIPVYNVEPYMRRCIDSVANQNYSDLEIILIDGGSTDNSLDICDEYKSRDSRVKVFRKANANSSTIKNVGLENFLGDYLLFINPRDCLFNESVISKFVNKAVKTDADVIVGKTVLSNRMDESCQDVSSFEKYFNSDLCFSVWNKLYKASVLQKERFIIGRKNEDLSFTSSLLFSKSVVFIDENTYVFFQKDNSVKHSFTESGFDILVSSFDVLNNLCFYQKNNSPLNEIVKTNIFTSFLFEQAFAIYKCSSRKEQKVYFQKFFKMIDEQNLKKDFYFYAAKGIKEQQHIGFLKKISKLIFLAYMKICFKSIKQ